MNTICRPISYLLIILCEAVVNYEGNFVLRYVSIRVSPGGVGENS
jgi:hypothetical protein